MNRFAKMKKERIYTLFETLSKNTDFPVDPIFTAHVKNKVEFVFFLF